MSSSAIMLTDSRNDITTVPPPADLASLAPKDVDAPRPGIIDLVVESGSIKRRIRLSVPCLPGPAWLAPAFSRASKLLVLPFNWDLAGAGPVEPTAIQVALDDLWLVMDDRSSIPQWTPTRTGGVQLDWHENGIDLEIEFSPSASQGFAVFSDELNPAGDWEGSVSENQERLRQVLAERLVRQVNG
jgi:hypothetical protein